MNKLIALAFTLAFALAGCSHREDHANDAKGEAAAPSAGLSITHYTDATQLFVECPQLVKGEEAAFAAHVTKLADFSALGAGEVTVVLSGGNHPDEIARAGVSANAGIFRPVLKPQYAGKRRLAFQIRAPGVTAMHDAGEVDVYESRKAADAAAAPAGGEA